MLFERRIETYEQIEICADFSEWPERWMGTEQNLFYGKQLLEAMRPFAELFAESGFTKNTIKRHLMNLWLLGGEIVRDVSVYKGYSTSAARKLRDSVGPDGGPSCRHLDGEAEMKSFDSTCRKLRKYMASRGGTLFIPIFGTLLHPDRHRASLQRFRAAGYPQALELLK